MINKIKQYFNNQEPLQIREKKAARRYARWQREKTILEQEREILEQKQELTSRIWKIKMPFSKLFVIFLFINFTLLEVFTVWITIQSFTLAYAIGMMPDFSPLITLLGAILGQTLSFGIYSYKSKAENTQGGIVYDLAMAEMNQNNFEQTVG